FGALPSPSVSWRHPASCGPRKDLRPRPPRFLEPFRSSLRLTLQVRTDRCDALNNVYVLQRHWRGGKLALRVGRALARLRGSQSSTRCLAPIATRQPWKLRSCASLSNAAKNLACLAFLSPREPRSAKDGGT